LTSLSGWMKYLNFFYLFLVKAGFNQTCIYINILNKINYIYWVFDHNCLIIFYSFCFSMSSLGKWTNCYYCKQCTLKPGFAFCCAAILNAYCIKNLFDWGKWYFFTSCHLSDFKQSWQYCNNFRNCLFSSKSKRKYLEKISWLNTNREL